MQVDEKIFLEINAVKQGMFLKGENIDNPVLLFLHGGPGSPEIAFDKKTPSGLEKIFTVCWWEQRGSGISYSRKTSTQSMTMEQMIADTIEVTKYLLKRFKKEKVYVMGHSWGTVLGIHTVQKVPELFYAYIGIGQVAQQDRSERLAYAYMINEFKKSGNTKMIKKLEKFPIDKGGEISNRYLGVRSEGMMKLGIGIMHNLSSMLACIKMVLSYKGYTLKEKMNYPLGNSFSLKYLWDFVMKGDFIKQVSQLDIPVYIFHGKFDYQVSYVVSREYAQAVKAPIKGFYTFEDSAHSPCFEEPEKMRNILINDVLQNKVELADKL